MSSRTSRSKGKDWSEWKYDESSGWYRTRIDSRGEWVYDYPPDETPRSEAEASASSVNTFLESNTDTSPQYHSSDGYDYQSSEQANLSKASAQPSEPLDDLSTNLERLSTKQNLPLPVDSSTAQDYGQFTDAASVAAEQGVYSSAIPPQFTTTFTSEATLQTYSTLGSSEVQGRPYAGSGKAVASQQVWSPHQNQDQYVPNDGGDMVPRNYNLPPEITDSGTSAYNQSANLPARGGQQQLGRTDAGGSGSGSGKLALRLPHTTIKGTGGKVERLFHNFKVHSSKEFKPGNIFKVLWSEPKGTNSTESETYTDATEFMVGQSNLGEESYHSIRRFVIVAQDKGHCQCLPILTYKRQGTTKPGVKFEDHAIIYTGDEVPDLVPGESPLTLQPIKVHGKTPRDKLEPQSRLNYAKIYTVEHNVKVLFIGRISSEYQERFVTDFDTVWRKKTHIDYDWGTGD